MNKEHRQLTKNSALDTFHPLISLLKELAPQNIPYYMMNKATKQMSVMEEKEINCTDHSNVHMMVKL
jgi:hypothetical protein